MANSEEPADLAAAQYVPSLEAIDKVERTFTYYPPSAGQRLRYVHLRSAAAALAQTLLRDCPPGRELSVAMTKLEECVMWANAAIARE